MQLDNHEMKTISVIINTLTRLHSKKDLIEALDILTEAAVSTLQVKGASAKILNERRNKLEIFSQKGLSDKFIDDVGVFGMVRSSFNQEAVRGNKLFISDLDKEKDLEVPEEIKSEGFKAIACLPIKLQEQIIGVFSIYDDKPRVFNENEKSFLDFLSVQGAAYIKTQRNYKRTETLLNLAKTINSSLDLDYVLNEIVIQATRTMKCRAASIRLLNESTNKLVFKSSFGLSKKYIRQIPKTFDQSPIDEKVIKDKEFVYIENLPTDSRVRMGGEAEEEGLSSMLCAPMIIQGKSIGILKIYTSAPTKFTKGEIQFLRSMAELSAVAVRNASMHGKLHSLYQVTSSLSSTLETTRLLDLLTMHAADYLQAMGAQILIWDKDKDKFSTKVAYHLTKEFLDSISIAKESWSAEETLKGNTIIISNIDEDERLDIREEALKADIHSMLSVPLKIMDRITGILQIYCNLPRNFTSDEIEFLTALANHGAIALENAKMHEHFKSEYERLIDDIYVWHDWTSYVIRS